MESNQYDIPFVEIPQEIELALKNSDRLRIDAEILAKKKRYNSVIPLITLSVEEFGKSLWLSEFFKKKYVYTPQRRWFNFSRSPTKNR